ncbi:MAG: hypothetical protein ACREUU_06130 [Gammaproteobacteria bacterium]
MRTARIPKCPPARDYRPNVSRSRWNAGALAAALLLATCTSTLAQPVPPQYKQPAVFSAGVVNYAPFGLAYGRIDYGGQFDLAVALQAGERVVLFRNTGNWDGNPPTNGLVEFPQSPLIFPTDICGFANLCTPG